MNEWHLFEKIAKMAGVREKEKKIEELERITFQEGGRGEKEVENLWLCWEGKCK